MATNPQEHRAPPRLVQRLQDRRDTHKDRSIVVRVAFVIAGLIFLLGGLAMMVLPGPALLVIPIGLAMLSLEFCWAGRLLDKSLVKADEAKDKAANASRTSKLLTAGGVVCAIIAAVVVALAYDVPGLPV